MLVDPDWFFPQEVSSIVFKFFKNEYFYVFYACVQVPVEARSKQRSPGAGITDFCELPDLSAGVWTSWLSSKGS